MARILIAFVLLSLLIIPSAFSQAGSPEGGCICPNGALATCGGNCPVCPTCPNICPDGVTFGTTLCSSGPRDCPGHPELRCVTSGSQPCHFEFQLVFDGNTNGARFGDYLPGYSSSCMHTLGSACLQTTDPATISPPAGWQPTTAEPTVAHYYAHLFRNCLYNALGWNTANGPKPDVTAWSASNYAPLVITPWCELLGFGNNAGQNSTLCGGMYFELTGSPISLIFGEEMTKNTADVTLVSFPVIPGNAPTLFTWQASADRPLLVYDPQHTGQIRSAHQLFGNYTFGGRGFASLATSSGGHLWKHGYEALGSLDFNQDGAVSGNEARDLALWFDSNRNGISEEGEVRSLESEGIKELYYAPDSKDSQTESLYASRGYLRNVGGRTEIGASVDWYSGAVDSIDSVLASYVPANVRSEEDAILPKIHGVPTDIAAKNTARLSGVWEWKSDPASKLPGGLSPSGVFFINEGLAGGDLLVTSVNVMDGNVTGNRRKVNAANVTYMKATRALSGSGSDVLTFDTLLSDGPGKMTSRVIVDPGGQVLSGETTVKGLIATGAKTSLTYSWTAQRRSTR